MPKKAQAKCHQCPECHSKMLVVEEVTTYMLNTGEHYCHSVKSHDPGAKVRCLDCDWRGTRSMF